MENPTYNFYDDTGRLEEGDYDKLLAKHNESNSYRSLKPPVFHDMAQSKQGANDKRYWNWVWANQLRDFFDDQTLLPFPSIPNRSVEMNRIYDWSAPGRSRPWEKIEREGAEFRLAPPTEPSKGGGGYELQILHIVSKVHLHGNRHLFEFEFSENDPNNMVYSSAANNQEMQTRAIDLGTANKFVSINGIWKPRGMKRSAQAAVARAVAYMALTYPFSNLESYKERWSEITELLKDEPTVEETRRALVTFSMYGFFNPLTLSSFTRECVSDVSHPLGRLLAERLSGVDELSADAEEWIQRQIRSVVFYAD